MSVCLSVHWYVHVSTLPAEAAKAFRTPGAGVTDGCELPDTDAGNWTDPLQTQHTVLPAAPSLQPLVDLCNSSKWCLVDQSQLLSHTLLEGAWKMWPFSWTACCVQLSSSSGLLGRRKRAWG